MSESVKGLDSLLKKLDKLGGDVEKVLLKSMQNNIKMVQAEAKLLCPVDTGELRNSIQSKAEKTVTGVKGTVFTNKEYAPYIEFGTGQVGKATNTNTEVDVSYKEDWGGIPSQPFMYPALRNNKAKVLKAIKEDVKAEIRRIAR